MPGVITPPHVTTQTRVQDISAQADYLRELWRMARSLTFLNAAGGVSDGTRSLNLDGVWTLYVSGVVANAEDTVAHKLGRIPQGFWSGIPDKAGTAYMGATAPTTTTIYVKCDVTGTTLMLWLY